MGNSKSKKAQKEPDKFFERERWKEQKREEKRKKVVNQANRRGGMKEPPVTPTVLAPPPPGPPPPPAPQHVRSYDEEALDHMRKQLHNDADAFLLNNILLSVQFFENFEREAHQIKNNPVCDREHSINEAMVRQNKHVFFADRLQECVHEHVTYQRSRGQTEPLSAPRMFVIYDNMEASEPGDTSDYSAVLDAPFYKLGIEDCKEPGYAKLKKIEVLESTLQKENEIIDIKKPDSDDSIYTDSEKESINSDDFPHSVNKGEDLLHHLKSKIESNDLYVAAEPKTFPDMTTVVGRRFSGPIKQVSLQVTKSNISNINRLRKNNTLVLEENDTNLVERKEVYDESLVPRKSILKNNRRLSGPNKDMKYISTEMRKAYSENTLAEDTETSGYRSNSSSRQTESSETESDYGYSTITESATPKRIELSLQSNYSLTSGALPDDSWIPVDVKALDEWSDDDDDEIDVASKSSLSPNLFERSYYLNSVKFMNNFVDNFIISLGSGLGLSTDEVNSALTQGASIYCNSVKNGSKIGYEIFPALVAAWPNAANQWIIRERRIIQNPRTNFSYQWPTKYMVNKAVGFGCLLVPQGFRPKRGQNPSQTLQWKLIFPAAERLYDILTCKNPLRIINPNIPSAVPSYQDPEYSSDSDDDSEINFWDKAKARDKHYQWKKERQRQMQERRKAQQMNIKKKSLAKLDREIKPNIILPAKMETERRRLVLEFFIPHFIAMARSSERFDSIRQALIYLEQAQRLCTLLLEEPGGDNTANEYLDVIHDKLTDCKRKLVKQLNKLPSRQDSNLDRNVYRVTRKQRPRFDDHNQHSPSEHAGIQPFSFVDVHVDGSGHSEHLKLNDMIDEESKL
ncbi:unnamed protein product [Chrysodeixis includens]|uniref:Uncharacterized protein n=1 Tax=Chrysodeixis includens TaxID=689277 RepID=A0A9N8PXP1_CHRIL|nr:unnamed protein product [Chrysodeixis includens]